MHNSSTNYNQLTVDQFKCLDINTLSEVEKLKLNNSRPKPDTATQDCTSRGLKFIIRHS